MSNTVETGPPVMAGNLQDPRVQAVLAYQQQVAAGDLGAARTVFWPDVRYTVGGRNLLSGTYQGPDEVMGYFGRLFELTDGTYTISRMLWLTGGDEVGLHSRNHATRGGRSLDWDELIVFRFVDGRKKEISHFSADQYGVDALLG
ncbi:MAG: nuclear transport factor 2 family protein [Pseudonocardia sp.]|nr:nuclear transport factor 2 family protein [Pseudonocardia sp.]